MKIFHHLDESYSLYFVKRNRACGRIIQPECCDVVVSSFVSYSSRPRLEHRLENLTVLKGFHRDYSACNEILGRCHKMGYGKEPTHPSEVIIHMNISCDVYEFE